MTHALQNEEPPRKIEFGENVWYITEVLTEVFPVNEKRVLFNFSKMIREFSQQNNRKTDVKFLVPWLLDEENFEIHQIWLLL